MHVVDFACLVDSVCESCCMHCLCHHVARICCQASFYIYHKLRVRGATHTPVASSHPHPCQQGGSVSVAVADVFRTMHEHTLAWLALCLELNVRPSSCSREVLVNYLRRCSMC
jgi:hypothetical protein